MGYDPTKSLGNIGLDIGAGLECKEFFVVVFLGSTLSIKTN